MHHWSFIGLVAGVQAKSWAACSSWSLSPQEEAESKPFPRMLFVAQCFLWGNLLWVFFHDVLQLLFELMWSTSSPVTCVSTRSGSNTYSVVIYFLLLLADDPTFRLQLPPSLALDRDSCSLALLTPPLYFLWLYGLLSLFSFTSFTGSSEPQSVEQFLVQRLSFWTHLAHSPSIFYFSCILFGTQLSLGQLLS